MQKSRTKNLANRNIHSGYGDWVARPRSQKEKGRREFAEMPYKETLRIRLRLHRLRDAIRPTRGESAPAWPLEKIPCCGGLGVAFPTHIRRAVDRARAHGEYPRG